ncbi:hypothetical protein C163_20620 [Pseudomonas sp. FGI182]|nr:hypothetical protein C163_20620 [Pseudomonas sp. FGI182]
MCGKATEWRRRALLAGELDRAIEVLEQRAHVPLDRLEAAFGHLRGEDLQRFGIGKAARQRFGDQRRIDPGLFSQGHHFGNHQGIAGHDHLVAGLGHLACAHRPHVRHPLAEYLQYRARPLQVGRLATDHDRQSAGFGPRRAAGNWRVQPGHAAQRCQFGGHFTGGGWLQAGEIDQQLAAAPALGDALLAEHHFADHGRVGQAQQQHVAVAAQFGRAACQARAGGDQCSALVRAAVPYRQRVTRGQQAAAHGQAHQADAGESKRR